MKDINARRRAERRLRQREFVKAIAAFIASGVGEKSIHLEMGKAYAQEWAAIRAPLGCVGYSTPKEAEAAIIDFLRPYLV